MNFLQQTAAGIAKAAELIRAGEIVAYPTETVYGLAAEPFNRAAVLRLFEIKGRAESQPILLVAADSAQVQMVAGAVSPKAQACIKKFWPGPLSLVLPKHANVLPEICAGGSTVCVRIPASEVARALSAAVGYPITSTSLNRSGEPPARDSAEIELPGLEWCLDSGRLTDSLPSTVYNPDTGVVYREGAIPAADLRSFEDQDGDLS